MKKSFTTIALVLTFIAFTIGPATAQSIDDISVTGGYELPVEEGSGENPDGEPTVVETSHNDANTPQVSSDDQTSFINGLAAGAGVGFVFGGILIWFLKPRLEKE